LREAAAHVVRRNIQVGIDSVAFDNLVERACTKRVGPDSIYLVDSPQQVPIPEACGRGPRFDQILDPCRKRDGSHASVFPFDIRQYPSIVEQLDLVRTEHARL
jgi:hypothetical protein